LIYLKGYGLTVIYQWVKSNLSLKIDFIVLIVILIICFAISVFKFRWYYD